jgi:hypothetical protein
LARGGGAGVEAADGLSSETELGRLAPTLAEVVGESRSRGVERPGRSTRVEISWSRSARLLVREGEGEMSWLCQWWTYLDVPFFNVPLLHLHSHATM